MSSILKCRKCRHELVKETPGHLIVISSHGEKIGSHSKVGTCSTDTNHEQDALWFLEEMGTSWICEVIEKFEWTKGKLNCPSCDARVGSFDFVSRSKCACGTSLLPAVQLVKSKVDSSIMGTNILSSLKT